jgi:hypothetical protein
MMRYRQGICCETERHLLKTEGTGQVRREAPNNIGMRSSAYCVMDTPILDVGWMSDVCKQGE